MIGPDPDQLREIALQLAQLVAADPRRRAMSISTGWSRPASSIRIDQDQARRLGLSSQAIAAALNTNISGTTVTQVRDDIFLIDVVARETEGQRLSVESLHTLPVALPNGRTIPLNQFATFEYGQDFPLVWRRDRVPTLTVQADVAPGVLPEPVVDGLAPADRRS